jgi:parvulin-like peptidyl-prolyl isomerase
MILQKNQAMAAALALLAGCAGAMGAEPEIPVLAKVMPEEALTIDALLTTVNGQPIFVKDVIRPLDAELRRLGDPSGPGGATSLSDFKNRAYEKLHAQLVAMVGELVMYSVAKDQLGEEEIKRIDLMLNKYEHDLLAKYKGARAMADAELQKRGSSVDKELLAARQQMMVERYKQKVIRPKITVRRQDVLEEYEKNISQYTVHPELDLYQITINVKRFLVEPAPGGGKPVPIKDPTAEQIRKAEGEAMALAQKACDEIKNGADFAAVAQKYSDDPRALQYGGRWQHFKRGTLAREDVEKKAFAMQANTLGEPFLSPDKDPTKAWAVVLKVGDVVEGHIKPFEEVQEQLENDLVQQQYKQLLDSYYKKLYEKSAIDNKERVDAILETATAVVVARYAVK